MAYTKVHDSCDGSAITDSAFSGACLIACGIVQVTCGHYRCSGRDIAACAADVAMAAVPVSGQFHAAIHDRLTDGSCLSFLRNNGKFVTRTTCVAPDLVAVAAGFLSRFEGSQCPAKLLEDITIVDTPGVLSGEKQRIERNYNFQDVCEWFAARCDLILLLFDPYKLDISDEFKKVCPGCDGSLSMCDLCTARFLFSPKGDVLLGATTLVWAIMHGAPRLMSSRLSACITSGRERPF